MSKLLSSLDIALAELVDNLLSQWLWMAMLATALLLKEVIKQDTWGTVMVAIMALKQVQAIKDAVVGWFTNANSKQS